MELDFEYPEFIVDALFNDYKYSIISAGRRVGKTYNAVQWLLESLLTDPDATAGLHVDTTQSNLQAYMDRYYKPMLKPIWHLCKWNAQRYVLELPGGKYIDFGSSQKPENLEGFEYQYAILNEAGIILRKNNLWYESIEPMLQNAKVRIIGTPKSKNLFHTLFQKGMSGDKEYKSFQFSAYQSPFIKKHVIDQAKKNLPAEIFRQNYLAEFIDGGGSVFKNITNCIREPKAGLQTDIMAIDLAKHEDFTVITYLNKKERQVTKIDRFNEIDWSFQKTKIMNSWRSEGKPQVIIDSTGVGDPIFDDLRNAGMSIEGFRFTNTSKNELIRSLMLALDEGDIYFPNNDILISELEVFSYDISAMGNIRYNAPEGFHDDCVISLALANHKIKTHKEVNLSWV